MNIITLDFETYYDNDYTLRKLTTEEYVRDPRFEALGVAIRWNEYPDANCQDTLWYPADNISVLQQIDWSSTALLCHHAQFDGFILAHHYGIVPALYLDTISMARLVLGQQISLSLDNLSKHFQLPAKSVPYDAFKGRHWHQILPEVQRLIEAGACQDVAITWDLFQRLAPAFPAAEYAFVDATVRMFTKPLLLGDTALLGQIWQQEETSKAALLAELSVTGAELRQNWRFAELLRAEGIEPEQKPGKAAADGSERWNYSFAKTDDFMRDLLDHEDPRVAMLAQAKLEAHSNGVQTRTNRLGWMSTRGKMCVYLNYAGTHLGGWSGGDKVNWQNFKRGGPIAKAIRAPEGFMVVGADASQVECRLLNTVAGQEDVVERFRQRHDPYIALASAFYGRPITKADEAERGTGKQGELSCGYGAGAATIKATAKKGAYGPPVYMSDEEALRLRDTYRETHPYVVQLWNEAGDVLRRMAGGLTFPWHCVHIENKIMYLPGEIPVHYESIEWSEEDEQKGFRVRTRRNGWTRIWGSKLVENLIQGLRNCVIRQAWSECRALGLDMVTMEHDKLVTVVREHEALDALKCLQSSLSRAPSWLPNISLDSEGYISQTLAKPEK